MRVARFAAQVVGWLFVAFIAYHVPLAAARAVHAARDGNWWHAAELAAIAIIATLLVVGAVGGAWRSHSRTRR